jgi:hypothetical protein
VEEFIGLMIFQFVFRGLWKKMVVQGSNYNIPLGVEDSLLVWITSLLFSTTDSTASDEI